MPSKKELLKENKRLKYLLESERQKSISLSIELETTQHDMEYLKELIEIELEYIYLEALQVMNKYSKLKLNFINSKISLDTLFKSLDNLLPFLKLQPQIILNDLKGLK